MTLASKILIAGKSTRLTVGITASCFFSAYVARSMTNELKFDNRNLKVLPIDEDPRNYRRTVAGACYSLVAPTPVINPEIVATSSSALALLGLSDENIRSPDFVEYFSGNKILPGSQPAAHCYCGHQFGHFSGQLGDGCAHYLGEIINDRGERWELQLKGSGLTPYSRQGDGRKVLRSSIREFLCSEAMHYLGIPTTRAGSCITSDTKVVRDIFYTGNNIQEQATVISRIAPSFLRFGSFEIFKTQDPVTMRCGPSIGMDHILVQLIDHTIMSYYTKIHEKYPDDRVKKTGAFFKELCTRTAHLVAQWQCVGFCHGVLNTDNMSIVGVTVDYGPYGFMDIYDPGKICNGSDEGGRYAYNRQPSVCRWNLQKLSEALGRHLSDGDKELGLKMYDEEFENSQLQMMRQKLGLLLKCLPEDEDLIESFLETLHKTGCDFTNGFRCLNEVDLNRVQDPSYVGSAVTVLLKHCAQPNDLARTVKPKLNRSQVVQMQAMYKESAMILNQLGITEELLIAESARLDALDTLKSLSVNGKVEKDKKFWIKWLEQYFTRLMKDISGMSQDKIAEANSERQKIMNNVNPRFILRNHLLQNAIKQAEEGNFSEVNKLLAIVQHPYSEDNALDESYYSHPTEDALDLRVT